MLRGAEPKDGTKKALSRRPSHPFMSARRPFFSGDQVEIRLALTAKNPQSQVRVRRHSQQHKEDDADDNGWPVSPSTTEGPNGQDANEYEPDHRQHDKRKIIVTYTILLDRRRNDPIGQMLPTCAH